MSNQTKQFSYWRKPRVKAETGLSSSTIYRLEKAKKFPQRYQLSAKIVAYRSNEVQEWMSSRLTANTAGGANNE